VNLAQAIELKETGGWRWRDVLGYAGALVIGLRRDTPLARLALASQTTKSHAGSPGGYRMRCTLPQEDRDAARASILTTIRQAAGEPLDFREISSLARIEFNLTTRRILGRLIEERIVETRGRGRAQVYWIRKRK
jgi:hypothetical protein